MTTPNDWSSWTSGAASSSTGADADKSGGDWQQWAGGAGDYGGQPDTNPFPYGVQCPISRDSSAVRVTLPKKVAAGATVITDVGVSGPTDGELPSVHGYELVDETTVLVHLSGEGDITSGPEYAAPAYPGGTKKAVPPKEGTPFVAVLVVPPAQQWG